ncbi:hypothetical protein [Alistipes indistinctus]|uniref:hypothetical protein n=1 Tax=Alistipes indistinctus TaxID=626932 RepID=UPI00241C18E9|nr:hypothetical protein [Alistipes indistinctus]
MADNEQVFRIVVDYKTAYEELERVKEKLKAAQSETRNLTIKQQELNEQFKQGVISEQEYQSASEALRQKLIANRKEVTALTEERRKAMQIEKSMALAEMAEANSLIQLRETLKTLTKQFDALGEAKQKSAKGVQLQKEIDGLNKKILELEMSTGRFGRNVGNYASGFNPLNFQVQQLTRELPSLTMNLQQFFLAISNNLPMFADELQRAAAANAKLKAEGHATIPVWRQVLSALGSWQTMLVVGITLLTAYGKEIGQWVKELFKGKIALNETKLVQSNINDAMRQGTKDAQGHLIQLRLLYQVAQDTTISMEKRIGAVKEMQELYPSYLGDVSDEAILTGQAKEQYEKLASALLNVARARAASKKIEENQGKIIDIQDSVEYQAIQGLIIKIEGYQKKIKALNAEGITNGPFITGLELNISAAKNGIDKLSATFEEKFGREAAQDIIAYLQSLEEANKRLADIAQTQYSTPNPLTDKQDTEEAVREAEKAAREAKKAAKDAADYKKQLEDDTIKYMREGREKDLADQKLKYQRAREEYKGNSEKLQELEEWNRNQILEINEKWDEKEIRHGLDTQKFRVSLMEDGTAKQLALLEIEHAEKLMKAKKNGTDLLEIDKWYKKEQEKILAASPHGERIKADAQAAANYHKEIARIESLKIKEKEKDYLKAKAENDLEKTKILNHKAEIDRLYSLGKITVDEYNKMSAEIGVDLANNENKGNELEDPKNPKLKKVGSFFARLFGYDPDDKDDRKEFKQKRKELIDQAADTAREIGQAVIDIQTEISQRRLKLEQERIDAERDSELKSLELRYNKGLMSEKAYNKAVEATNAEADRKKEEAERAAFEREKRLKIMGIAIDTAAGITKVWSETGLTGWKLAMAIAQTAFLTANGIAQTAVISNQQFAQGGIVPIGDGKNGVSMGMLQGPSHSQGGIPLMVNGQPVNAEVEGGEILAVINKRSAAQYLPLFSAINATNGVKFENGGVIGSGWTLPTPAPLPPSQSQRDAETWAELRGLRNDVVRLAKIQGERVDNLKVYVVEKDITKAQKKVANIKAKATIIGRK